MDSRSRRGTGARYLCDLDWKAEASLARIDHAATPALLAKKRSTAALAQPTRLRVNWV